MRGEECRRQWHTPLRMELPPHARRRAARARMEVELRGITSACAEKRWIDLARSNHRGNYLRMRGEELLDVCHFYAVMELPPHARRRDHREHFR